MRKRTLLLTALCLALFLALGSVFAYGADLDRIHEFSVTVDVNEDGTLNLVYHVEWEVLDSDSYGPLEWVTIGIPNRNYVDYKPLSSTIKSMSYTSDGGPHMRIDLDKSYYEGDVVQFDYLVVQDYMYEMNKLTDGETVYDFTPAWFDDCLVDLLQIRWNSDNAISQEPASSMEDGYYVWTVPGLSYGESVSVRVTYPNDAYAFDISKSSGGGNNGGGYYEDSSFGIFDLLVALIAFAVGIAPIAIPILLIVNAVKRYNRSANFNATDKKITRTKVVYYDKCPGCGAPRPEGANNCEYCGRSFIKSEEIIEEKDIPKEEKELRRKTTSGLYAYSTQPNTYIRINVTPVPRPRSSSGPKGGGFWGGGGSSSGRSSGSSHSSHHSSCAHSSCACACACACAGSGRAGCSTKDFYNTDLKLRQLELRKEAETEAETE